ncbi:unnamed protein product [Cunninghamella echinulata]
MSRLELITPEGLRVDGRRANELEKLLPKRLFSVKPMDLHILNKVIPNVWLLSMVQGNPVIDNIVY